MGVTAQHGQEKASRPRRPASFSFAAIDNHTFGRKAFRARPGMSNFQPRRHRWNLCSLPPPCLEYRGLANMYCIARNCESVILLCLYENGRTAFGHKSQEVLECLLLKFSGSQGTQCTMFHEACWRRGGRTTHQMLDKLTEPHSPSR